MCAGMGLGRQDRRNRAIAFPPHAYTPTPAPPLQRLRLAPSSLHPDAGAPPRLYPTCDPKSSCAVRSRSCCASRSCRVWLRSSTMYASLTGCGGSYVPSSGTSSLSRAPRGVPVAVTRAALRACSAQSQCWFSARDDCKVGGGRRGLLRVRARTLGCLPVKMSASERRSRPSCPGRSQRTE
mgnify:CR=1 FL=1